MSESTLLRKLKNLTWLPTVKYINEIRLNKARDILYNDSKITIGQVASDVGFKNTSSFSRNFKQRFGKAPKDFQKW